MPLFTRFLSFRFIGINIYFQSFFLFIVLNSPMLINRVLSSHRQTLHKFLGASIAPSSLHRMGDLLRSLQTTADGWRFIGGTPENGELLMAVRVVFVDEEFKRNNFKLVFKLAGGFGPCFFNFYEAWQK